MITPTRTSIQLRAASAEERAAWMDCFRRVVAEGLAKVINYDCAFASVCVCMRGARRLDGLLSLRCAEGLAKVIISVCALCVCVRLRVCL